MRQITKERLQCVVLRVLRKLRGNQSQVVLARRLHKSHDAVSRWESGAAAIRWLDFCDLLEATREDGTNGLSDLFLSGSSLADWSTLMRSLGGEMTAAKLSKRLGLSLRTAKMWLEPEANPLALEALYAIELMTPSLVTFLGSIVDLSDDPDLGRRWRAQLDWCAGQAKSPYYAAIHGLLARGMPATTETNAVIAKRLGLAVTKVAAVVDAMLDGGEMAIKDGVYELEPIVGDPCLGDKAAGFRARCYWMRRAIKGCEQLQGPDEDAANNVFGSLTFQCSPEGYQRIEALARTFFNQVRDVVCSTPFGEQNQAAVLGMQLLGEAFLSRYPDPEGLTEVETAAAEPLRNLAQRAVARF